MRIHRISLRDFRGVGPLDVELDPAGVTVIEGRNEVGKTSIADGFLLLLDYRDSSKHRHVQEVKPIGRDVGPFVEAELTVGPYRLTYRKQWLKGRKTELEIVGPEYEQLTGESAHSRMNEILEENTDPALFRALRYQQGVAISQATVVQSPSLLVALDAAAGGSGARAGAGQEVLLEKVEKERLRYFTEKGAILAARKKKAERLGELRQDVETCEARIRDLEDTAERQREIERELGQLREQFPEAERQIGELSEAVGEIERLENSVESKRYKHEQAESALREATAAHGVRSKLIESAESAAKTFADLEGAVASTAPDLASAQRAAAEAEKAHAAARAAVESAERETAGSHRLLELFERRLERDQLQERYERVAEADEAIQAAERFLAGCAIDAKLLGKIDEAVNKLAVAEGRAEAGKPRLSLEALRPVRVTVDGEQIDAVPGAPIEKVVSERTEATIGDLARVVVSAPEAAGEAGQALAKTQKRLDALLREAGVASQADAHEVTRERSRHEIGRENAMQRRADALRDLEAAQLGAKLERAQERVRALEADRDISEGAAGSFDDARAAAQRSDAEVEDAKSAQDERQTALMAAQGSLRVLEDRDIEQRTRLAGAKVEAERSAEEIKKAREQAPDDDLAKAVADAEERVAAAVAERKAAEEELASGDPASARAMLENARKTRSRLAEDIKAREIESASTRAQLELGGHEGLSDRLAQAQARLEDLQREVSSEDRRAAAVEHLHAVLIEKRDQAQQAYIGPFREKVNAYARILYGPAVEVAVDHGSMQISSRTLDGTKVPFGQLSGGAEEQLAVLARLACGALVSPSDADGRPGGVPVIIDDALGYSDPGRLERLGAAITVAGRDCQVIVLTCEPGRYRGVGGAKVISLT
ncbi:MAG: AAA family ATPase [Solirubrobacteraceae bacterium]